MKHHIPTITIAVCAYNEEQNIAAFLRSILAQEELGFIISRIVVISDGATDNTTNEVRAVRSKKIHLLDKKKRLGKSSRLNELYQTVATDILVQSDADVVCAHPHVIAQLIQPLLANKAVGMCGGNPTPLPATTFIERGVNATVHAYIRLRHLLRGGNNVFSADGRLLAFRREVVQSARIPKTMIANDMYMYFYTIKSGYTYHFVPSAIVLFRSPQTVRDHIRQNTRFLAAPARMSRYFPADLVKKETAIPFYLRLTMMIGPFLHDPTACLCIFVINRYCALKARLIESQLTAKWQLAITTKKLSKNNLIFSGQTYILFLMLLAII